MKSRTNIQYIERQS